MRNVLLVPAAILMLYVTSSWGDENWPRFRGPNGTGVSDATSVPVEWTEDDFNWSLDLPGTGHSSPVVWGGRLFLTSADVAAGERYLLGIDTGGGEIVWRKTFPFAKHKKHKNNSYATSTPCADAERVYSLWQAPGEIVLTAHRHDGAEAWRADLGPFKGGHGGGISPIVVGDLVIVGNDNDGPSELLAIDRALGEVRWRVPRESKRTTYATPCVYRPEGRSPELVFTDWNHGITGVDAATGQVRWELSVFGDEKERAIGSPVVAGDLVIGTCGFVTSDKHAVAVRPEAGAGTGDEVEVDVKEVWRIERAVPHIPTALVVDDLLFLWSEKGIVTCVDAATGEAHWQQRVGGNFSGSPVAVGGRVYCANDLGEVVVLAAAPEYKLLARNPLGAPTRATPAVAGGVMYWRTASGLVAVGGR